VNIVVFVYIETRNMYRNLSYLKKVDYWGDPVQMWENNIKMDLRETGYATADWVELLLGRFSGGFLWLWWQSLRPIKAGCILTAM